MRYIKAFLNYLSLIKFSHTVFALPFALIGFFMAIFYEMQPFNGWVLLQVLFCMVFARSAAMAFNRYLDRKIDLKNPRTKNREIPAGVVSANSALIYTIINALFFIATTYYINKLCFYLSPVALFVILFYSYTKRFTPLCHLVLGVGLGLAPIGAFIAVTGYFHILPILVSIAVITWTAGFDIIYALQDSEFDRTNNLYSIPGKLGHKNALIISTLLHVVTSIFLLFTGILAGLNWIYWVGFVVFTVLLIYQHIIVKPHDLSKINMAFGNTNGIASILFSIFTILSLYFR